MGNEKTFIEQAWEALEDMKKCDEEGDYELAGQCERVLTEAIREALVSKCSYDEIMKITLEWDQHVKSSTGERWTA